MQGMGQVEGAVVGGQPEASAEPRADGGFRSLADEVRAQGADAARAGQSPSTCPYRVETSQARILWLEGYLAVAEQMGRIEKSLADILLQAVRIARAKAAGADNVVTIGGGL